MIFAQRIHYGTTIVQHGMIAISDANPRFVGHPEIHLDVKSPTRTCAPCQRRPCQESRLGVCQPLGVPT
jgi:hypothetical protein